MFVVTAKEMYDTDRYAMERVGLEGKMLMENAGRAIAREMEASLAENDNIMILVGKGNNGGDGFVIARTLLERGYAVEVLQCAETSDIRGDAAFHREVLLNMGYSISEYEGQDVESLLQDKDVVIDALLGIGIKGAIRPPYDYLITLINQYQGKVLSVDLPSGIPADEGYEVHQAVEADQTIVVQFPKVSSFLQHTAAFYGDWTTVDIGLPSNVIQSGENQKKVWGRRDVVRTLPSRSSFSHKGTHGKGLVIGGAVAMPGSIAMTSRAALRAGAGLLTIATVQENVTALAANVVEATYHTLPSQHGHIRSLGELDFSYDGIAIGMGMGRHEQAPTIMKEALLQTEGTLLIDADGLYALKQVLPSLSDREGTTVLTPHPGEMAHLLGITVPELLQRPFSYAQSFATEHDVYVVLKGAFTLITNPKGDQWINPTGNAGLAKGGTGDVLSGILLSMLMQPQTVEEALCNGVWIHGYTADILIEQKHSSYDLLASDVIEGLPATYRNIFS